MALYNGLVSLFERNGAIEIRRVSSGGYTADEVNDLVTDLLELKKPVSKWSLWIDGIDHKQTDTYSSAVMSKLIKGNQVELIAAKRNGPKGRFMAPVLKITAPGAAKAKAARNETRLGR